MNTGRKEGGCWNGSAAVVVGGLNRDVTIALVKDICGLFIYSRVHSDFASLFGSENTGECK